MQRSASIPTQRKQLCTQYKQDWATTSFARLLHRKRRGPGHDEVSKDRVCCRRENIQSRAVECKLVVCRDRPTIHPGA